MYQHGGGGQYLKQGVTHYIQIGKNILSSAFVTQQAYNIIT